MATSMCIYKFKMNEHGYPLQFAERQGFQPALGRVLFIEQFRSPHEAIKLYLGVCDESNVYCLYYDDIDLFRGPYAIPAVVWSHVPNARIVFLVDVILLNGIKMFSLME